MGGELRHSWNSCGERVRGEWKEGEKTLKKGGISLKKSVFLLLHFDQLPAPLPVVACVQSC